MAFTPEQEAAKKETAAEVTLALENEVAKVLKENYEGLAFAFPDLAYKSPEGKLEISNDDFRDMARQAIDKREIDFKTRDGGKTTITLGQINDKLMSNEATKKIVTARGATHLEQLVLTRSQANRIAGEVGDAAAENAGTWHKKDGQYGTTGENYAKGILNTAVKPWTWFSDRATSKEPAAKSLKEATTAKLEALRRNDPDIRRIVSERDVTKTGDKMWKVVMHGKPAQTEDPLADVTIKPLGDNEAIRAQVGNEVNRVVYEETKAGITKHVEDGLSAMRNNGFLGILFQFLEMIGLGKFVAKLFGKPIPEEQEINNAAQIAADAASVSVEKAGSMSREDFITTVKNNVKENLKNNKEYIPSFNDDQIDQIATKVAAGIDEKYDTIPRLQPTGIYADARDTVHPDAKSKASPASKENLGIIPPPALADASSRNTQRSNSYGNIE